MMSPVDYVIKVFGGVRATARAIGRSPTAVSKWRQPTDRGGSGGRVPNKAQPVVLQKAKELGLDITGEDLILGRPTEG